MELRLEKALQLHPVDRLQAGVQRIDRRINRRKIAEAQRMLATGVTQADIEARRTSMHTNIIAGALVIGRDNDFAKEMALEQAGVQYEQLQRIPQETIVFQIKRDALKTLERRGLSIPIAKE